MFARLEENVLSYFRKLFSALGRILINLYFPGVASVMEPLAKNLKAQALCLQFDYENTYDTIGDLAETLMPVSTICLLPFFNLCLFIWYPS